MLRNKGKRAGVVIGAGQNLILNVNALPKNKTLKVVILVRFEGALFTVRGTIRNKPTRAAQKSLVKANPTRNSPQLGSVYRYDNYLFADTSKSLTLE